MSGSPEVSPKVELLRIDDVLSAAKNLNEAIHMACGYIGSDPEKWAIQAVSDALGTKLNELCDRLDQVREALK